MNVLTPSAVALTVFGLPPAAGSTIGNLVEPDHPSLDPVNPSYRFYDIDVMRWIALSWGREWSRQDHEPRKGVYLHGPTGTGKSSCVREWFARLNVPLVRFTWDPRKEAQDLLLQRTLIDGTLVDVDGPITRAARYGLPLLIDEVDLADPAELTSLNDLIESGLITLPSGEVVRARRGFVVFATGNTAGTEDETGAYRGTRGQNVAFLRRFYNVRVGYPTSAQLEEWLTAMKPAAPKQLVSAVADAATRMRQAFEGTKDGIALSAPISQPEVLHWLEALGHFQRLASTGISPAKYALKGVFSGRLSLGDQEACDKILEVAFASVAIP